MINNFELVIGIEIHIELNTKTKCFSPVSNDFNGPVNQLVSPIDLGYPGTLPLLNQAVVVKAIKLAKALNMEIDHELHFDRKNYYYTDLPKGFQITQQFRPIGENGILELDLDGIEKKIEVERIHIEEDTARQLHQNDTTFINYNRAGVPLIEIVSKPQISSAQEAAKYVDTIRQIVQILNISDAKMAEGSLRADVNLSTRLRGDQNYGTRVEIKNLNSLNNIKKAIEFESQLQIKKIINNEVINQETKRFDEATNQTVAIREKTDAIDYRYFPEPNLPVIKLDPNFVKNIKIEALPKAIKAHFQAYQVSSEYIEQIINNPDYLTFLNGVNHPDVAEIVKIFFAEIVPLIKKDNLELKDLNINPKHFHDLINIFKEGIISGKQLKLVIPKLANLTISVDQLLEQMKLKLISDENVIIEWIESVKAKNPNLLNDYQNKPEATTKFVVGEIMKLSKGQANPILSVKLVNKLLGENEKK